LPANKKTWLIIIENTLGIGEYVPTKDSLTKLKTVSENIISYYVNDESIFLLTNISFSNVSDASIKKILEALK
jgi:hypothetical protein